MLPKDDLTHLPAQRPGRSAVPPARTGCMLFRRVLCVAVSARLCCRAERGGVVWAGAGGRRGGAAERARARHTLYFAVDLTLETLTLPAFSVLATVNHGTVTFPFYPLSYQSRQKTVTSHLLSSEDSFSDSGYPSTTWVILSQTVMENCHVPETLVFNQLGTRNELGLA